MQVILAKHYGMCFGVRDALRTTHEVADAEPVTILGELVHNEVVHENLARLGVRQGQLRDLGSAATSSVVITAHGAADRDRQAWKNSGRKVVDTTCPLVRKAHLALGMLVSRNYHPVVIGKRNHVEVLGLTGDYPEADVILTKEDVDLLEARPRFGVVAQTTQPSDRVAELVAALERRFPSSEVRFTDTVCQPTKDRQLAMRELCQQVQLVIVVGGTNSNNTEQLVQTARANGIPAHRVGRAGELDRSWFRGVDRVGVTAGTSTLDEIVAEVFDAIRRMG